MTSYTEVPTTTGGTDLSALGLGWNSSTGVISSTSESSLTAKFANITVTATNSAGTATVNLTIVITTPQTDQFLSATSNKPKLNSADNIATYTIKNISSISTQQAIFNSTSFSPNADTGKYFTLDPSDCLSKKTIFPPNTCKVTVTFNNGNVTDGNSYDYYFTINYTDNKNTFLQNSDKIKGEDSPIPSATLQISLSYPTDTTTLDASHPYAIYTIKNISTYNQAAVLNKITSSDATHFPIDLSNAKTTCKPTISSLKAQETCDFYVNFPSANIADGGVFNNIVFVANYNSNNKTIDTTSKPPINGNDAPVLVTISNPDKPVLNSKTDTNTGIYTITNHSTVPVPLGAVTINSVPSSSENIFLTLDDSSTCKGEASI